MKTFHSLAEFFNLEIRKANTFFATFVIDEHQLILYIEGVDEEYNIFDTSGRLIYSGCDPQISLPQGLYLVKIGNALKRVIL